MLLSPEIVYSVISILPGVTILVFMFLSFFKYRNQYLGYFLMAYVGTGLLSMVYLIETIAFYSHKFSILSWLIFVELLGIVFVIEGLTWLVVRIFYENSSQIMKNFIILIGLIPILGYLIPLILDAFDERFIYNIIYIYLYIVLAINCLIFILKYRKISNTMNQRLGVWFAWLLFAFIVLFVLERFVSVVNIIFNPMPAFFLLWTILLISYMWKNILESGVGKLFEVQKDFTEKYNISKREEEIIKLVLDGHKNAIIGEKLFISEKTVTNHIYNIYKKLEINSRFELICLYKE